jgi:2-C-methyl-D-erythritol 4-phosphate cytidylyltransferase
VKVDCVIVAGSSTRFGADKLLADLEGRPVLARSLAAFESIEDLGCLTVVTIAERVAEVERLAQEWAEKACVSVIAGGERRRDSVESGLRASGARYVAIHDGARPLVTRNLIERVIAAAEGKPGAIAAIPVTDTVKEARGGIISAHLDRSSSGRPRRRRWSSARPGSTPPL